MWISSVNGGTLVPLTNIPNTEELGGSWSTDGTQFAYLQSDHDAEDLMIVKTTGNALPRMLKKNTYTALPEWSPTGEWIRYHDKEGWWLISPDGKVSKFLGQIHTKYLAFSKNGRLLYGIDTGDRLLNRWQCIIGPRGSVGREVPQLSPCEEQCRKSGKIVRPAVLLPISYSHFCLPRSLRR